jgi:hypothetical protein
MPNNKNRANIKLDLTNRDILRFAKRVTGKDYNEFLREYLDAWILCASAYREFTYVINVASPESITVRFFGKSRMISGSAKVTSLEQIAEIEREMIETAEKNATVEKGMSFNHVAKQLSRAKLVKRCK